MKNNELRKFLKEDGKDKKMTLREVADRTDGMLNN